MRCARVPGLGLFLIVLLVPRACPRAEPLEPGGRSLDEEVGRVGGQVITRRDVLRDGRTGEWEFDEVFDERFRSSRLERARLLAAVRLAAEARLEIQDELVSGLAHDELERKAQDLSVRTGVHSTAEEVLSRLQLTRAEYEGQVRLHLLRGALGIYLCGGHHALDGSWTAEVEPDVLEHLFEARRDAYQVRPGVRFISCAILLDDHLKIGLTREDAVLARTRTTEQVAEMLRAGLPPVEIPRKLGIPASRLFVPHQDRFLEEQEGALQYLGAEAVEWVLDPARRRGEVEVFSSLEDDLVFLFLERRAGRDVSFEEVRGRIAKETRQARERRAIAAHVLELAREPGFITPPDLAHDVEARAVALLEDLRPYVRSTPSESPPLPTGVLDTFDAALEEAVACGCLLYVHIDPVPEDAFRAVSDATLERLAKHYVVAVVSGRVGDRAADRLRLRYGLMRPGGISVAIAPSGVLLDDDVPFAGESAWRAMQTAEQAPRTVAARAGARLSSAAEDAPVCQLWFDPWTACRGEVLSVLIRAANDTPAPLAQLRATVLLQGPSGGPRLRVLRLGAPLLESGYDEESRYQLRPDAAGWLQALVLVDDGATYRRGARARVYVR